MSLLAQDERLTRRVGAATILVMVLAIAFFVFRSGARDRGDHLRIRVFLHHAGGLKEGAPLVVAGKPVGTIESIARSPQGAAGPLAGDEGIVAIVAIEPGAAARLTRGGDVFVASHGPLSERYLELGVAPANAAPYRDGDEVLGRDPPSLDRVLQRTWTNLMIAKAFADAVRPDARALAAELDTLRQNLEATLPESMIPGDLSLELAALAVEATRLRDTTLGGPDGLARIDAVIGRGRGVIAKVRVALDQLAARARTLSASVDGMRTRVDTRSARFVASLELAIERGKAAIDKLDPLLAQVQLLSASLARGEGSLGRLMRDPEFPEDAKELGKILKRQPWKIISRPTD